MVKITIWRAWCPKGDECRLNKKHGKGACICRSAMSLEDLHAKIDHHLEFSSYHNITDADERKALVLNAYLEICEEDWDEPPPPKRRRAGDASDAGTDAGISGSPVPAEAKDGRVDDVSPGLQ